jgi:CHAT domain-containing protein
MARIPLFRFRSRQSLLTLFRLRRGKFTRLPWLTYLFIACLTALLCLVSPPVFAQLSSKIAVTQVITAPQLLQQGRDYYDNAQFAASVKAWQQAAQAYQARGERINQAMVLSNLALAYQALGQLSEAKDAIATSLQLLQSAPNSPERRRILAQALNTQGSLQMAQGNTQQALTTLQQATDAYRQVGDEAGVVRSLLNQAQILRVLGFYRRALSTLSQVNQTLQTQPDSSLKASGLRHLGNALRLIGDLNESQKVLQQSREIAQKLSSPSDIAAALLSLGNTARAQQQGDAALQFYQQAAATHGYPTTRIQALVNQLSLMAEGGIQQDISSLIPPLLTQIQTQLIDLPPNRIGVYARINLAQNLMKLGNLTKERERENFPIPNSQFPIPNNREIANILATAIEQASALGDKQAEAYALGSLGGLYEKSKQWTEAQKLTQKALVLTQAIDAPDIAYRWQWQLGRLLKIQGDERGAIAAYSEAINTLQSLRNDLVAINSEVQFSFKEGVEPVYREFVSLLLQTGDQKTSPERLEKARKVIESLQLAELDNFFRAACLTTQPVQIDAIDRKAAVIYPIILPDRLEVILSLPNSPLRHYATDLPQDQVESTVKQLRRELITVFNQNFLPLSKTVYDWLIRPIEADLAQNQVKTLVFVLDGSLRNIPMAALHDGKQYLIEKYAIALTPGLELLESQPLTQKQLKVLTAGLSEARQGFSALPAVEAELNQILSEVPGEKLFNQEFTKSNLQNAVDAIPFPVVHLATHGQFSSKAEETFILTWDDRINVNELNNFLQKTDQRRATPIELLVLSACQTAKGDNRAALGIAGVAVRAGARSTLATLWSVNDEATSTLMSQFYQELGKERATKAEAIRRAQQSILQNPQWQHPYYWAPYVLVGNWL